MKPVVLIVMLIAGASLLFGGLATAIISGTSYTVPGEAMQPTYGKGGRVFIDRMAKVKRGDVVAVKAPGWTEGVVLSRVIGMGGDRLACCDQQSRVLRNGKPLDESYLARLQPGTGRPFQVTVPQGRLWIMGDNREFAYDSRQHVNDPGGGTIATGNVEGRVLSAGSMFRPWPAAPVLGILVAALGLIVLIATGVIAVIRRA